MRTAPLAVIACVLTTVASAQAPASAITWAPAPPFFPAGARFAVLQGDPSQPGIFTVRLELPAGYIIRPHSHTTDEYVTVMSGALILGEGDSVRTQGANALSAGEFATARAGEHHYAVARGKTIVQIHGQGPFVITYVNPKDDPRNAPTRP
jgi:quercetin dioxygenase-like cupin family protein